MQQKIYQSSSKQNITTEEKLSIKNLQSNHDIIINSADKGGEIVIINRNEYIENAKNNYRVILMNKQMNLINKNFRLSYYGCQQPL